MSKTIKILICDQYEPDANFLSEALSSRFDGAIDFEFAYSVSDSLNTIKSQKLDLVITRYSFNRQVEAKVPDASDLTRELAKIENKVPVLVYTGAPQDLSLLKEYPFVKVIRKNSAEGLSELSDQVRRSLNTL